MAGRGVCMVGTVQVMVFRPMHLWEMRESDETDQRQERGVIIVPTTQAILVGEVSLFDPDISPGRSLAKIFISCITRATCNEPETSCVSSITTTDMRSMTRRSRPETPISLSTNLQITSRASGTRGEGEEAPSDRVRICLVCCSHT
jgi:hypothetical protein